MNWFYNLKLSAKLLIGFVMVALIAGMVGMVGTLKIKQLDDADTALYEQNAKPLGHLVEIVNSFQRMRVNVYQAAYTQTAEERKTAIEHMEARRKVIAEELAGYEKSDVTEADKKMTAELKAGLAGYDQMAKKVAELAVAGKQPEAIQLLKANGASAASTMNKIVDELVNTNEKDAKKKSDDNTVLANGAVRTMIVLVVAAMLMAIAFGIFISRMIMRQLGADPKEVGEVANLVAVGDLTREINLAAGDSSSVMAAMKKMVDTIKALVADAGRLSEAAVAGRLATRADASKHQGDFQAIVVGVNQTLDAVIGPLNVAAEYVDRISKGDIPPAITDSYNGDFNEIKNNLNQAIEAVNALVTDANMLSKAAVEGKLATRADASKHQGDFRKIVAGVNETLDAVIGPLNVAAEYVDRISKGDIPPKIVDNYNGDFNEIKNNLNQCIDAVNALVSDANMLADAAVAGRLTTRADASTHRGDFRKIVDGVNDTITRLVGFLDSMSAPAMIIDKDFSILYMNETGAKAGGKTQQQVLGGKCYDHFKTSDCRSERCACSRAISQGQVSTAETDAHPMAGLDLDISYTGVPIKDRQGNVIGAFEVVTDLTAIKTAARVADKQAKYQQEEVGKLLDNLEKLAIGDLNLDTTCSASDEDTQAIARNFEKINTSIKQNIEALSEVTNAAAQIALGNLSVDVHERSPQDQLMQALTRMVTTLRELAKTAEKIAEGDLTVNVKPASDNDAIGNAFAAMVVNLREIVGNVGSGSDSIATATKQIATGNADLAQRTETQASSLEEIASSMEELTSTVKQNADNSQQANQLAIDASDVAVKGGTVISRVVETMDSISGSSKKIADIISVIDGIAFQTNILALNAAVEAARAGEQGRGFAVVAGEVRNLAQRSAAAAKEIKELISDSVDKVGNGSRLVGEAGQTMQEIVTSIKRVTDIMGEISAASVEQSSGIEQVNGAITSLDEITQQNASVVQQATAAAGALEEQAQLLVEAVNRFKLDNQRVSFHLQKAELTASQVPAQAKAAPRAKSVEKSGKANGYHKPSGYRKTEAEDLPLAKAVGHDADWNEF